MPDVPFDMPTCLALFRHGDQHAANSMVAQLHPLVLRLVRAHRPAGLADDDLVQEVFLTMFARLDRYSMQDGIPFEHWLSRLAVNVCIDALRAENRRPRSLALSSQAAGWLETLVADRQAPVDEALAARELVELLLSHLSAGDRLLLTLLDLDQLSTREVSAVTGWNRALIKVRAFRARRRLKSIASALAGEHLGEARRSGREQPGGAGGAGSIVP
jgi:RNA polymerase sigma-70 factor (ECF subfamily)